MPVNKIRTILSGLKRWLRKKISLLLFCLQNRAKESRRLLNSIKDSHKGERIFIVCNGPSLTAADLDKIAGSGDKSFGSNSIDKIFSQTVWRPDYYCVTDESYQYSLLGAMNNVPAVLKFFRKESYITTRRVESQSVWLNVDGDKSLLDNPAFAEDVTDICYGIASVTYVMLQIAVHMGFREIYIIGCDNRYSAERMQDGTIVNHGGPSHFGGADNVVYQRGVAVFEMNRAFAYAAEYAARHDIKIYNATRGGYMEAFPRVDFDSLF